MSSVHNGMRAADLTAVTWLKSSFSGDNGCVELARLDDGSVAVRNSRFPQGPALVYTQHEINVMLAGVKAGDFDQFLG